MHDVFKSRLVSHSLHRIAVPIHVPFTISRESLLKAELLVVELQADNGMRGLGECSPFPSLTYDTIDEAYRVASGLINEIQGLELQVALARLRTVKDEATCQSITGYVGVECALWDLWARAQGKPLAVLFGSKPLSTLYTDITMPIMPPAAISSFWQLFRSYEFPIIKAKVSGDVDQDLVMLRALQKIAPQDTRYILDGNQGFTVEGAYKLVEHTQAQGLAVLFFEQPLPERDLASLEVLSRKLPVPVCVDETVRTVKDLQELLDRGLKPIVNIKIMKSGVEEALRIIQLAQTSGCELMIGGMLESEIAMSFSLHMACGTGAIRYADLDTPFFFKNRLTRTSPWHTHHAKLSLPIDSGLGLELALPN